MTQILSDYLSREYHTSGKLILTTEVKSDVDCSSLPIEMLKSELEPDELLNLIEEENDYHYSTPPKKLRGIEHIFGG